MSDQNKALTILSGQQGREPLTPIRDATSFGELVRIATSQSGTLGTFLFGTALTFATSVYLTTTVPLWGVVTIGFVLMFLCVILLRTTQGAIENARCLYDLACVERERYERERRDHAKNVELLEQERRDHELTLEAAKKQRGGAIVDAAIKPYSPYQTARCIFIVRWPGDPLPVTSRVVIAVSEATHERPLGGGIVRPQQQDGRAVITLDELHPDTESILGALLDKQTHDENVKKVRIGPAYDLQNINTVPGSSVASGGGPSSSGSANPSVGGDS